MSRDFAATADPDKIVLHHVIEELFQADRTSGMTNDPEVQPDRHHARHRFTFAVQHIETVPEPLLLGSAMRRLSATGCCNQPVVSG
jgi:hypothetical protein